jgi:hypothetical protein
VSPAYATPIISAQFYKLQLTAAASALAFYRSSRRCSGAIIELAIYVGRYQLDLSSGLSDRVYAYDHVYGLRGFSADVSLTLSLSSRECDRPGSRTKRKRLGFMRHGLLRSTRGRAASNLRKMWGTPIHRKFSLAPDKLVEPAMQAESRAEFHHPGNCRLSPSCSLGLDNAYDCDSPRPHLHDARIRDLRNISNIRHFCSRRHSIIWPPRHWTELIRTDSVMSLAGRNAWANCKTSWLWLRCRAIRGGAGPVRQRSAG